MNNKVADFVGNILMIKIISQQLLYSKDNIDEKYIASETDYIHIYGKKALYHCIVFSMLIVLSNFCTYLLLLNQ